MAEKDILEKAFIALNDVFADIFNVLVFHGQSVVEEEMLTDRIATSQYKADDEKLHEQERDVFKQWKGHGFNLILAGKILDDYIQDYKIHVFDIPRLSKETVEKFQSDFKVVAEYFTNVYTNPEYVPEPYVIRHVDEFLKLMKVLTGDKRYETMEFSEEEKKEGIDVCRVLDYREARGEARGEVRGMEKGMEYMSRLIRVLNCTL